MTILLDPVGKSMSNGESNSAAAMLTSNMRVESVPAESLEYSRWPMCTMTLRLGGTISTKQLGPDVSTDDAAHDAVLLAVGILQNFTFVERMHTLSRPIF